MVVSSRCTQQYCYQAILLYMMLALLYHFSQPESLHVFTYMMPALLYHLSRAMSCQAFT